MDKTNSITRRAAIVGAAASVAAISPALGSAYRSGANTPEQLLVELVDQFKRDAMAIDPSVTGLWLVRDMSGAVQGVFLDRPHATLRASDRKTGA